MLRHSDKSVATYVHARHDRAEELDSEHTYLHWITHSQKQQLMRKAETPLQRNTDSNGSPTFGSVKASGFIYLSFAMRIPYLSFWGHSESLNSTM